MTTNILTTVKVAIIVCSSPGTISRRIIRLRVSFNGRVKDTAGLALEVCFAVHKFLKE